MISNPLAVFGLSMFVLALVTLAIQSMRQKRALEDLPVSQIRSAAMGLVQVTGNVEGRRQLSPLFKRPCLWWRCVIETGGKNNLRISETFSSAYFCLEEGNEKVVVDPEHANYYLDEQSGGATLESASRLIAEATGKPVIPLSSWTNVLVREQIIPMGRPVFVRGTLWYRTGLPGTADDRWKEFLEQEKDHFSQTTASSDRGEVDPQEWDAFRTHAEEEFKKIDRVTQTQENKVLRSAGNDSFIIALKSPTLIEKQLRFVAIGACSIAAIFGALLFLISWKDHLPREWFQVGQAVLFGLLIPAAYLIGKNKSQN